MGHDGGLVGRTDGRKSAPDGRDDMRHSSMTALLGALRVPGDPSAACSILALALAALVLGAPAALAQSDISGVWEIDLDTQTGEATWTATFEQDGASISGEIDIGDRMVLPLEGKVDGASIAFTFIVPDLDGDMPINLSGQIEGATIEGDEGDFVWYGAGRWTGAKK